MEQARMRLAEVLAALALATDLGMGQPTGHAMQTTVLAARLARTLCLPEGVVSDVFYLALLRYVGCTADAAELALLAGDEIALGAAVGPYVMADAGDRVAHTAVTDPEGAMAASMSVHCEAAGILGARLGHGAAVTEALRHGFERWDGRGHPEGLAGEQVPVPVRIAIVARDMVLWQQLGGLAAARAIAQQRRGRAYDPQVVDGYLDLSVASAETAGDPGGEVSWADLLAAEPAPRVVAAERLDDLLEVFADFADLKLPLALGHSRRVASAAAGAGMVLGLDDGQVAQLRRAGLVHDLGRVGVSSRIWSKTGALTAEEWERVRLHPYLTERILLRCPPLAGLASVAGSHHERLDGSGYHRGLTAANLGRPERIVAAADAYVSLREDRPHRPAVDQAATVRRLQADISAGLLDGPAVRAVAESADEQPAPSTGWPLGWPAGLTDREVDVLRLAARGCTIRQVATRLGIASKTVDRHLQNCYAKIGVSSRAGAALFALRHGLLH